MQIKTKVSIEQEVNIEIELPAFYKNGSYNFMAVIEESVISVFQIDGIRTHISHDSTESSKSDIVMAYKNWEHISEEEFFENLDKALKDFNFKPSLIERKPDRDEAEEERKLLQGNY
jgi:hypothetical protein